MRVLIIANDRALGLFLQKGLDLEGHQASWFQDGGAALVQCKSVPPQLIVLDVSLRRASSFALLSALRNSARHTSILILTESCGAEERIRCFDAGADDCMLKPFNFHELAARCRAMLRRAMMRSETGSSMGTLHLDFARHSVEFGSQQLDLTRKEFALLACLIRRQGACCSREELLRDVWQTDTSSSTNVVDVYITYLRKKLATFGVGGSEVCRIETVRGSGYRITFAPPYVIAGPASTGTDLALGA